MSEYLSAMCNYGKKKKKKNNNNNKTLHINIMSKIKL